MSQTTIVPVNGWPQGRISSIHSYPMRLRFRRRGKSLRQVVPVASYVFSCGAVQTQQFPKFRERCKIGRLSAPVHVTGELWSHFWLNCDCRDLAEDQTAKWHSAWVAFYDFPAEHWRHIRTTNPIESAFATIRLRHRRTKGSRSRRTSLAMMFKLGIHVSVSAQTGSSALLM
jgi:hypothetical protein